MRAPPFHHPLLGGKTGREADEVGPGPRSSRSSSVGGPSGPRRRRPKGTKTKAGRNQKSVGHPAGPISKRKEDEAHAIKLEAFPHAPQVPSKENKKRDDKGEDGERVSGGPKWNLRCASMDLLLFPAAAQQAAKKVPIVILKRMEIWRQTCRRLSFLSEVTMFCYTAPLFQPH